MRLIKMFGLAAIAAIAATAFVGASSASATSATTLCTENTGDLFCPENKRASHVHFTADLALLLNAIQTVECDALFLGTVQNANLLANAGTPLTILGNLTYTCHGNCQAQESKLPSGTPDATINVLKTASELATVTGEGEVLVLCGTVIHCKYIGENLSGHALGAGGGGNGHVTFNESSVAKLPLSGQPASGLLCPSSAKLDALFESLTPLYTRS